MDLLDRLLGHDSWTTKQLLSLCQKLTDEQLDMQFDIAHRSVRSTCLHIIRNMEIWSDLMSGIAQPEEIQKPPKGQSISALLDRLDLASAMLETIARSVAQRAAWDECFVDILDDPPAKKTYGGGIAHVITHSMHHRAQLLYMLKKLGVEKLPEGDVLGWENRRHQS